MRVRHPKALSLHKLLSFKVFGRIKEQLKQIKQGLKETYVLDLWEARPDAITQVFPSEAEATCSSEVITLIFLLICNITITISLQMYQVLITSFYEQHNLNGSK